MVDKLEIPNKPNIVEFPSEITITNQRAYIHIPTKYIKFKQIDPKKIYRVIMVPIEDNIEESKKD